MKKSILSNLKVVVCASALILSACSDVPGEQSGVTSTGNPGEISGIVVVGTPNSLHKKSASEAEQVLYPVQMASLVLYDENGVVSSTETDGFGRFHFDSLQIGEYILKAQSLDDTASLMGIIVQEGMSKMVRMVFNGISSILEKDWMNRSTFSDSASVAKLVVPLQYDWNESRKELTIYRNSLSGGSCTNPALETKKWSVTFSGSDALIGGVGCLGFSFFSYSSTQIVGNNLFFSGDLKTSSEILSPDGGCPGYLPLLPEMKTFGAEALRLDFRENGMLYAVFEGSDWCMADELQPDSIWENFYGQKFEKVNCHQWNSLSDDALLLDAVNYRADIGSWFLDIQTADSSCVWNQCNDNKPICSAN